MTTRTAHHLYMVENIIRTMSKSSPHTEYNGKMYTLDAGMLPNEKSLHDFFQMVSTSPYTIMHFGMIPACRLVLRKNLDVSSHYNPSTATISIAQRQWSMCKMVVLHELAHHIDHVRHHRSCDEEHHDEQFMKIYTTLVKLHLSEGVAELLHDMVSE